MEAIRLYWMLERLSFAPTGTATHVATATAKSFSKTFSGPLPDTADLVSFGMGGSVVGGAGFSSTTQPFVEPAVRVCPDSSPGSIYQNTTTYQTGSGATLSGEGAEPISMFLAYVGEWRLYYRFVFIVRAQVSGVGFVELGRICNDADISAGAVVASGNFSLFGLTIPWDAKVPSSPTYSFTGAGLLCSETFLSF